MLFSLFRKKKDPVYTVGFYNLENLFDTKDDPGVLDDDFTPDRPKRWTPKRYRKKINKLSRTIARLGSPHGKDAPSIVGVAEVENSGVLRDLLEAPPMAALDFDFVHFDSPDERGIDTALFYDRSSFKVVHSEAIPLILQDEDGDRDYTRDILYVHGKLNGEPMHIFVNHWPSRRRGEAETEYRRVEASATLLSFMEKLEKDHPTPNYIIMGDFNDGPDARSIKQLIDSKPLYNPMEKLQTPFRGSANYKRTWSLFDQIIVSTNFFDYEKGTHSFAHANIFDAYFLKQWKGKYRGNPFRTYVGKRYLGGYSDHFPVFIQLKLNR